MSAKKKKDKPSRESGGMIDRGTVAGGLAACLVLVAWAFVHIGSSAEAGQGSTPQRPSTPTAVPNQEKPPVVTPPPVQEPAYKQGIRDAIALGKEGLADFEDAVEWKEKVGGDPFKFANMVKEAGAKVTRAVVALESLRDEAKGDTAAQKNIDQWIKYFEERVPTNRK
ncbi:MAG: hypothetical protein CMJ94_03140 [Planctomycetes bacterium]|nr:hypothetical protein [Planctomycetota bacterium]